MNTERRRALLGQAAVKAAKQLADTAPPLTPDTYAALAVLLTRQRTRKDAA